MQKYVLCVVIDDKNNFVGLTKNRGWQFLIGKKTFPGGKVEGDESLNIASTREFEEETGVFVNPQDWIFADRKMEEGMFDLYIMAAKSNDVNKAYTKETELVWTGNVEEHLKNAIENPGQYVDDFIECMQSALKKLERGV